MSNETIIGQSAKRERVSTWERNNTADLMSETIEDTPVIGMGAPEKEANPGYRKEKVPAGFFYKEPKSRFHSEASPEKIQVYNAAGQLIRDRDKRLINPDEVPFIGFMSGKDGDEKSGILTGAIKRMMDYYKMSWNEEYKPLKDFGKNIRGWAPNLIKYWIAGVIESGLSGIPKEIAEGFKESFRRMAKNYIQDISPMMRTLASSYGPGKSYIDQIWVYKKTHGGTEHKVPIFFNTFKHPTGPTEDQLNEGIRHVDTNLASPFDNMEKGVSGEFLNSEFINYSADAYTGNLYDELFREETTTIHRWFVKEDTKGSHLWRRDTAAEASLPPSVSGQIEIYKKNVSKSGILYTINNDIYGVDIPTSGDMAWLNVKGDFAQDISYIGMGAIVVNQFLKRIGVEPEGRRIVMEKFYKIGSKIHDGWGADPWLTYNIIDGT